MRAFSARIPASLVIGTSSVTGSVPRTLSSPCAKKKDIPLRHKPDRTWGIQTKIESSDRQPFPKAQTTTQCVFCFWNTREPCEVRLHNFSTVYKTRDHVELHLKQFKENDDIPCLDPKCQASAVVLRGHMHFKNHEARMHNYDIFRTFS